MLGPGRLAQQYLNRLLAQVKPVGLMAGESRKFFAAAAEDTEVFGNADATAVQFFHDGQGQGVVETVKRRWPRNKAEPVLDDMASAGVGHFHEHLPGAAPGQAAI